MNYIVITSIHGLTPAIEIYANLKDWKVVVVGDTKSKPLKHDNVEFINVEDQNRLGFVSLDTTPYNHYSRKNIGYLYAISQGASLIFDTDDDTFPYKDDIEKKFTTTKSICGKKSVNIFKLFTKEKCWPRGLDLSVVNDVSDEIIKTDTADIGVWQGIINDDSDFDAIYRLTVGKHVRFNDGIEYSLKSGSYCPFNTQSTLWNSKFNILLYIPISVDFRFSDILRSYVTQRILWNHNHSVGFHSPNTYQIRNDHDYFKDFLGEIEMYRKIPDLIRILDNVTFSSKDLAENLYHVYEILEKSEITSHKELLNLKNWIIDFKKV